jgi:hypothetical protein
LSVCTNTQPFNSDSTLMPPTNRLQPLIFHSLEQYGYISKTGI